MEISKIIKLLNFILVHEEKTAILIKEIYFYKNYKLIIEYNIDVKSDDEKLYTLMFNIDNKDMSVLDVFGKRVENQIFIFSNLNHQSASDIIYQEFSYNIRKEKINKLN